MSNILITGGKGFIGAHLVYSLKDRHNITVLDGWTENYPGYKAIHRGKDGLKEVSALEIKHRNIAANYRSFLTQGVYFVNKWTFGSWHIKDVDLIINCGSLSEAILSQYFKDFTHKSIVTGLEKIKELYPKVPILHFSSSMSYGTWEGTIQEDYPQNPVDLYGKAKKESESLVTENDIILRPMHVYGYGDGKFPITMNIERQAEKNQPVNVEEADCIYIKDLVDVINILFDSWVPGIYNLSSGFVRDKNVIKTLSSEILKIDIETTTKSGPTGKPRGRLDNSKLMNTFNWKPKFNTYEETIKDYFNLYMKETHESDS